MDRRSLLAALALLPALGCGKAHSLPIPGGQWIGTDPQRAHRLRASLTNTSSIVSEQKTDVLLVGGGVGSLSAAWWLARQGVEDFLVCEMENEVGGNSREGRNAFSRFPLGAHYLPLPTRESRTLRELLAELGAIEGDAHALRPRYAERLLCAAPQERLFRFGHWQEGVIPDASLTAAERAQVQGFFTRISAIRARRDGVKAFSLPMAASASSADLLALDRMTFGEWLAREGFDCEPLRWYADYACRDDFGCTANEVSAWAGLHYFAARDGEAEGAAKDVVLTSSGGNGWIASGLAGGCGDRIQCGIMLRQLTPVRGGYESVFEDLATGACRRVHSRAVIWGAPLFLASRLIHGLPELAIAYANRIDYAPWVVAQLSMASSPREAAGVPRAWDNVIYGSRSLGYVVATHQNLSSAQAPSVWTWYHVLTGAPTPAMRRQLLELGREHWAAMALSELAPAYPDLIEHVECVDVVRYGHAMAKPLPGFLNAPGRHWFAKGAGMLQFAHADVSGFSICEEAHSRGVAAAERIAAALHRRKPDPSLVFST